MEPVVLSLLMIGGVGALLLAGLVLLSRYLLGRTMRAAQAAPVPREAPTFSSAEHVARLRREAQLTYVELARRSGVPARLIAEVELGLKPLAPEHAMRLVACLRPSHEQAPLEDSR
jgi:hypothetical protein